MLEPCAFLTSQSFMQRTYEGAARRLARVLELSDEATKEMIASRPGKRARPGDKDHLAHELSKAIASQVREPDAEKE